jgi:hypothetical protein
MVQDQTIKTENPIHSSFLIASIASPSSITNFLPSHFYSDFLCANAKMPIVANGEERESYSSSFDQTSLFYSLFIFNLSDHAEVTMDTMKPPMELFR